MTLNLKAKIYNDETAARKHLEALQWPEGPICPHCGVVNEATPLKGKSTRPGVWKCRPCQKPFSVTVGTVFERSHIPLTKWLLATELLTSSKKGISAHQLHRMLGITYKSAWFMAHRIREAMGPAAGSVEPMGGEGKIIEADETYIGRKDGTSVANGFMHKRAVVTLVERQGKARSFHVEKATKESVMGIVRANVDRESRFMTDEAKHYKGGYGVQHDTVKHKKGEYARGDVSTNTVEGFFSIFKRGFKGIYQHCGEQHLQRYLNEYDFRYNNRSALGIEDSARAAIALEGIAGKRLTYRRINGGE